MQNSLFKNFLNVGMDMYKVQERCKNGNTRQEDCSTSVANTADAG